MTRTECEEYIRGLEDLLELMHQRQAGDEEIHKVVALLRGALYLGQPEPEQKPLPSFPRMGM